MSQDQQPPEEAKPIEIDLEPVVVEAVVPPLDFVHTMQGGAKAGGTADVTVTPGPARLSLRSATDSRAEARIEISAEASGVAIRHWLDNRLPEQLPDAIYDEQERRSALDTLREFESALADLEPTTVEQAVLDAFVLPGVRAAILALRLAEQGRRAAHKVRDSLIAARGLLSGSRDWLRQMSERAGDLAGSAWLVLVSHADSSLSLIDRFLGLL